MFSQIVVGYAIIGNMYFERVDMIGRLYIAAWNSTSSLSLFVSLSILIYLSLSLSHNHNVVPAHTWKLQMTALSVKYMTPTAFPRS